MSLPGLGPRVLITIKVKCIPCIDERLLARRNHSHLLHHHFLAQRVALGREVGDGLVQAVEGEFHRRQPLALLRRQRLVQQAIQCRQEMLIE